MDRTDYEVKTVPDLRTEAGNRGLSTEGLKADLVDRLVADDERRAELESQTVADLQDEARDADLPVSGTKAELVDRLADEPEPELTGQREQRVIEAGGHQILVDVDPETPEPMDTCSICGAVLGTCVHSQDFHGRTWDVSEPVPPAPASETHWPDETVGPRSMVGDETPDADTTAAAEIAAVSSEEE